MRKATLNYWVDVGIGVSYVVSALSGLVFLLPVEATAGVLGVSYAVWDQVHVWSSLLMMTGVTAHLALHWKWIVGMTRKLWMGERCVPQEATCISVRTPRVSRRRFLSLGLAGAAAALLAAAFAWTRGASAEQDDAGEEMPAQAESDARSLVQPTQPAQPTQPVQPTQPAQPASVACPRGLVNDPYPGRCRRYRDSNGNGFCDYSEPSNE